MAFSKIILNGTTLMDITQDTVTANTLLQNYTAHGADGQLITGTATAGGGVDIPVFTITVDEQTGIPSTTCNKTYAQCYALIYADNYSAVFTNAAGYFGMAGRIARFGNDEWIVYVAENEYGIPLGEIKYEDDGTITLGDSTAVQTLNVGSNGTYTASSNVVWNEVNVSVSSGGTPTLQTKTASYTPTETAQSATITADSGYDGLSEVDVTVAAISPTYVGSGITSRSSTDLTASGDTVSVPAGYYASSASKAVSSGTEGTPVATKGTVSNHAISVTPSVTNTAGYISGGTSTGTAVTVSASELDSGTKSISSNGTGIDVVGYAAVDVAVTAPSPSLQTKTKSYTPTESQQTETVEADSGYDGLSAVDITVGAISPTYVGSGIDRNDSTDLTASGATVTAPAGYYATDATKSVSTMTLPTSASASATSGYTSKATISRSTSAQYINIPSGYNSAGGYYTVSATPNGTVTAPSTISGSSASVTTGTNTLTLTKTVSVTPSVTTEGYVSSGTAGNSEVSLTASVNTRSSSDLTASGATVTVPAGYYGSEATKSVTTMTLPTSASSSATSGYASKATIGRSTSAQYINIPPGYNSAGGYYTISAVANGTATAPSTISGSSATVSTGTNTLTLTKTVSVTPTISTAGYISSGTAGNSSVSLTANVTTKAAATYNTSSTDQTIASGTYLTGTQTIRGVTVSGLSAENIASGITVKVGDLADDDRITSVTGTLAFATITTGSGTPSGGNNGDIYIKTS